MQSLMGPHHNSVLSLERSGSSLTFATSVPVSFRLLLLGYLQPVNSSVGQAAVFYSSRLWKNAHILILIQEIQAATPSPVLVSISLVFTLPSLSQAQVTDQCAT